MTEKNKIITRNYQACVRCIMDTVADRNILFDEKGICHHCQRYDEMFSTRVIRGEAGKAVLDGLVQKMKEAGRGRDYDCIIGVSGGVDSTYVAWLVKQLGLRPLALHLDNGWNSELAVKNIERVLNVLDIDLKTLVLDWSEFRDLQKSFLMASTPDGDIPSDHAINALLWREAVKHNIKYIVSGMNFTTESIYVPDWAYGHSDWRYIMAVHRRFGSIKLDSYPHFSLLYLFYINLFRGVRTISILNYINYDKNEAVKKLTEELGWQNYGGKHHESVYTRFYQGYVLPKKFGVDKRYGHLSDLVNAGQLTRSEAIEEMKKAPYSEAQQEEDLIYVRKKLGLSEEEFEEIMKLPVKSFRDYQNSFATVNLLKSLANKLRGIGLYPR
jgi:N-acetyl sugar amidotransferase